jgi:hypothetical protein
MQEFPAPVLPHASQALTEVSRPSTLREVATSSTETEEESPIEEPPDPVLHQATQPPPPIPRQPTASKAISSPETEGSPVEGFVPLKLRLASRLPKRVSWGVSTTTSSSPEVERSPVIRQSTRLPTRVSWQSSVRESMATTSSPSEPEAETKTQVTQEAEESFTESTTTENTAIPSRKPTVVSRKQTRVWVEPQRRMDIETADFVRWASGRISRPPARIAAPQTPVLVQRDVEAEREPEPVPESIAEPDPPVKDLPGAWPASTCSSSEATPGAAVPLVVLVQREEDTGLASDSEHSSVLNDPLAAYDVYRGAASSEEVQRRDFAPLAQDETVASSSSPPSAFERQPTAQRSESPPDVSTIKRQPTTPIPHSRASRAPTTTLPRLPTHRTLHRRLSPARIPRILTIPPPQARKLSSAAPGIVAPPTPLSTIPIQPHKKMKIKKPANYPPEHQYPPAPAYPMRETPGWTRPDGQTPPLREKKSSLKGKGNGGWLG